jgi:nucleoside-diphosphate-sugar epimerase
VGDVRASKADIARAGEAVGYEPRVSFREGLERTCESMAEDDSLIPRIKAARAWTAASV